MTDISKRFEQLISSSQKKLVDSNKIMPVKTEAGILVGDVLIVSDGCTKHLWKNHRLVYENVSLNDVAIRLANLLAKNVKHTLCLTIYQADQEYGKWFADCQFLKYYYHKALQAKDYERVDILQARYQESKARAEIAKSAALRLVQS